MFGQMPVRWDASTSVHVYRYSPHQSQQRRIPIWKLQRNRPIIRATRQPGNFSTFLFDIQGFTERKGGLLLIYKQGLYAPLPPPKKTFSPNIFRRIPMRVLAYLLKLLDHSSIQRINLGENIRIYGGGVGDLYNL